MPGTRGKGNRRSPGRDGGARSKHIENWRKQARHAVADQAYLASPLAALLYMSRVTQKPDILIYKFDQQAAKADIRYHAEYHGRGQFTIRVSKDILEIAQECVEKAGGSWPRNFDRRKEQP